jgi:hypothetical protein
MPYILPPDLPWCNLVVGPQATWLKPSMLPLGLYTVPSDGYGRTFDGQVTGTGLPSTVHQVCSADPQRVRDGYGDGHSMADGSRRCT